MTSKYGMTSKYIDSQGAVCKFLERPEIYPDKPSRVETKQTHISRVYLTRRFAYKLKKPVVFDFLDFSTLPLRRSACEDEIRLNRRFSPNVYLHTVPVCRTPDGKLHLGDIGDNGEPIEWLVKMRRLDESRNLASMLSAGILDAEQLVQLTTFLADYYSRQAPVLVRTDEYTRSLSKHIESNRNDLLELAPGLQEDIHYGHAAQKRFLNLRHSVFDSRVCDGRIIDGHGDLRPEHIYFERKPAIIDCIEFNSEYRRVDVIDELAFLAMECDLLGADYLGHSILQTYFDSSNDRPVDSLIAFYKCYRATVRAKVTAFQCQKKSSLENGAERTAVYLRLARHYARAIGSSVVVTIGGLMGSGKSTLAKQVADHVAAPLVSTDVVRNELFKRHTDLAYNEGKYSVESRNRVYTRMFSRIASMLRCSPSVVLDGTFSTRSVRQSARRAASDAGAAYLHIECECPSDVAQNRIAGRHQKGNSDSEARPELFDRQVADYENCTSESNVLRINTTMPLSEQIEQSLARMWEVIDSQHSIKC